MRRGYRQVRCDECDVLTDKSDKRVRVALDVVRVAVKLQLNKERDRGRVGVKCQVETIRGVFQQPPSLPARRPLRLSAGMILVGRKWIPERSHN